MKVISITSSYRKNGNTNNVIKLIEEHLTLIGQKRNNPIEIEDVSLAHENIQLCHGCRICFDKGEDKCPLQDNLLSIKEKIEDADGIIIASPVYVEDVNGIMKNWIDRMAFNCHRPLFSGKIALVVTTSGIGSSNHPLITMKRALNSWGFYISGQKKFRTGALMPMNKLKAIYNDKILKVSKEFFDDLLNERRTNPSFYALISFKVQQRYWQQKSIDNPSIDYQFWKQNGWIESKCKYYIEHKASFIKVQIARIIGSIVALFFT